MESSTPQKRLSSVDPFAAPYLYCPLVSGFEIYAHADLVRSSQEWKTTTGASAYGKRSVEWPSPYSGD